MKTLKSITFRSNLVGTIPDPTADSLYCPKGLSVAVLLTTPEKKFLVQLPDRSEMNENPNQQVWFALVDKDDVVAIAY